MSTINEPLKFQFVRDMQRLADTIFGKDNYSIAESEDLNKQYNCLFEFENPHILRRKEQGLIAEYPVFNVQTCRRTLIRHMRAKCNIEYLSLESGDPDYNSYVKLICTKKGELWKLLLWANNQTKKSIPKPILDDHVYQSTIVSALRFLKYRKNLKRMNITTNKGILIYGEPGNGKTLITSYLKSIAENKGLIVSVMTEKKILSDRFYGDVIILDDFNIDSLSARNPVADMLLSRMDGPDKEGGKLYLVTTNELTNTDKILPPFLRPGRIDCVVELKRPSEKLRERYVLSWQLNLSKEASEEIISRTNGFSFAQLNHIQTEIAMTRMEGKPVELDNIFKTVSLKLGDNIKAVPQKAKVGFFYDDEEDQ